MVDNSYAAGSTQLTNTNQDSPSDSSFSLGGSAVWVGDESGLDFTLKDSGGDSSSVVSTVGSNTFAAPSRKRRSTDASSSSSQAHSKDHNSRVPAAATQPHYDPLLRSGVTKDTHFYHTSVAYRDHQLPIKMPLSTFPEEVGDVCCYFVISNEEQLKWEILVLLDHSDKRVFFPSTRIRSPSPSPSYKWATNSPDYHPV